MLLCPAYLGVITVLKVRCGSADDGYCVGVNCDVGICGSITSDIACQPLHILVSPNLPLKTSSVAGSYEVGEIASPEAWFQMGKHRGFPKSQHFPQMSHVDCSNAVLSVVKEGKLSGSVGE